VIPTVAGAATMGTGIVSIALRLDGRSVASDVLMAIACALWAIVVVATLAGRLQATSPEALTTVAGTCVLGTRLSLEGWDALGLVLGAGAAIAWPPLLRSVLRHWSRPAPGAAFLVPVSAEGLAVLAATLARGYHAAWPAIVAVALLFAGLGLYAFAAWSFDPGQLARGAGDHWVAGGALAIAALAAATTAPALPGTGGALGTLALVLWSLAMAWLPVLVVAELVHPRLHWGAARWATVFPLGMYAAMSYSIGAVDGHRWITDFGRGWTWVACAAWVVMAAASARVARTHEHI
jgi:tellurite resistance protein TehA-like permease